ncbi:FKBP-type peptidyl-prolyl cis-trans isomerase [Mucilaginibacter sp.]|uniref:FKBP-type peptidyl-prolyl cis-trans isomerase n=1 Tax=Mucilaginibacter sp. TaxID=1882438 RepID=UPI0028500972|nr:FKBP-type peptidyl-prolyl cis-trans isomerase [Mucilaginibacter sp.]MDR3693173.1 FKBP-type peptidyl-prolyl cis-trans isomerase [Mucilaginibacter sp.]
MKQTIFSVIVISIIGVILSTGMTSCRKDNFQPTIKQYDSIQINNYIAANGLTGFLKDTTGGDTTGMYYKIISPGSGPALQYADKVAFVYTYKTLDGVYVTSDTISNHYYDYVGHIYNDRYPLGMQTAVHNLLKYSNASMRVLIPSHLAYGRDGRSTGSTQVANNNIPGNESLDVYIHAINYLPINNATTNGFPAYDDMVIQNYMKANNLTGYVKTADGLYYSILTPGTGTDAILKTSSITATYTGQLLDGNIFAGANGTNTATLSISDLIPGVQEGLQKAVAGTKISLLIPSSIGYGISGSTGIAPFSCLRFTWQIVTVTQ